MLGLAMYSLMLGLAMYSPMLDLGMDSLMLGWAMDNLLLGWAMDSPMLGWAMDTLNTYRNIEMGDHLTYKLTRSTKRSYVIILLFWKQL